MKNGTLTVASVTQAALFAYELSGQISDGHWENSRPMNHWKPWCCAVHVAKPGEKLGRNFYAQRDRYNFCSRDLLEAVEKRMITYARIATAYGFEHVETLEQVFDDNGNFRGLPSYEGEYYDGVRESLKRYDLEEVQARVAAVPYGHKELIKDLRALKQTIKMRSE
jgi:hypothetical protein